MKELSPDEIRSFQQERGLNVTGELNESTLRAFEESRWKLGDRSIHLQAPPMMRGDDIATLQVRLTEMGFNCGRVDGIFGPLTELAVKEFQKSVGAKVDGRCGPATIIALLRLTKTISGGAPYALRESARAKNRGPALADKIIVLDPGSMPGESEITFDIAQRIEGRLLALGASVFFRGNLLPKEIDIQKSIMTNKGNFEFCENQISTHICSSNTFVKSVTAITNHTSIWR
jgi:N-acetylmuramoyl-L-alanine amidase